MPLTEQQKEARKNVVGSSEIPALFNKHPWQSAYGVWLEKTGQLVDEKEVAPSDRGKDPRYLGTMLESSILDMAEDELGKIKRNVHIKNPDGLPMASNLDGLCMASLEPVEAKASGLIYRNYDEWGAAGTDQLPTYIVLQCQAHIMNCGGNRVCHVPVLLGGRGFVMYEVKPVPDLMLLIADKVDEFWKDVRTMTPPKDVPLLDEVKRIIRVPDKQVTLETWAVNNYLDANENAKVAEAEKAKHKAILLSQFGDAEYGVCEEVSDFTFYEQVSVAHQVKESKFRMLRAKKARKGK